jgi:hypothetical protein
MQLLDWGIHLGAIRLYLLHSPPFCESMFHTQTDFSWPRGPLHSTFSHEPNVRVATHNASQM